MQRCFPCSTAVAPCIPVYTREYRYTAVYSRVQPCTAVHTCIHVYSVKSTSFTATSANAPLRNRSRDCSTALSGPLKPDPGNPQIHLCSSHVNAYLLACLLKCTAPVLGRFWQNGVPGSAPENRCAAIQTAETRSWDSPNPPMQLSCKCILMSMSAETGFTGSDTVLEKPGSRKCT